MIHNGEELGIASGRWQRSHDIHMDMGEGGIWVWYHLHWGADVSLYLGQLASYASPALGGNVMPNARPYESITSKRLSSAHSWVGEVMQSSVDCAPQGNWNKGAGVSSGDVTHDRRKGVNQNAVL